MSVQVKNLILADKLRLISKLLQLDGASIWKRKAYDKAADVLASLDVPATSVSDFKTYPGIGNSTAHTISEILKTDTCPALESLRKKHPNAESAFDLTIVSGVGVKKAIGLYKSGITNLKELSDACDAGKISNGQIVRGVKLALKSRGRLPINEVIPVMAPLLEALRNRPEVVRAEFCGSVRRGKETIKDVDVIVVSNDRPKTAAFFDTLGDTLIAGEEKARVMVPLDAKTSVQFDLLFAEVSNFGAALAYFTGSKEHNISLRKRALSMGYTINEHGIYKTHKRGVKLPAQIRVGGEEEKDIYQRLHLPWCPPELREGSNLYKYADLSETGEWGTFSGSEVPKLITRADIFGDWHVHSTYSSDAKSTILDMAISAKVRGLRVIGITDHTEKNYKFDPKLIPERSREINVAKEKTGLIIYSGCETGVNLDGSLDWPDQYLERMDYVIASIHRRHSEDPVNRLIKAARHPKVKIIGHPTGRMLGRRDIPEDNWKELFKVCAEEGVLVEINGARLDLPVSLIKMAKAEGCKFVLNGDAHSVNQLHWQDYAITFARRGGLIKSDLGKPMCEVT